jgi:D-tyrosyl-tRNA(Tyr) deacylase
VSEASVVVDGAVVGSIGPGLVVLLGVTHTDTEADAQAMADKLVGLRVFRGEGSGFDRSVVDVDGSMLVISQFTLYGDVRRGRRPSFTAAAAGPDAEPLYRAFTDAVAAHGIAVETGVFGAMMEVSLVNDGPVTVVVEAEHGSIR